MKYLSDPEGVFATSADQLPRAMFVPVLNHLPISLLLVFAGTTINSIVVQKLMEQIAAERVAMFIALSLVCLQFFAAGVHLWVGLTHDKYPRTWVKWFVVAPAGGSWTILAPIAAFMLSGAVYFGMMGAFGPFVSCLMALLTLFLLRWLIWFVARQGYEAAEERVAVPLARKCIGLTLVAGSCWLVVIILAEVMKIG
jgi:hypothetical protein